MTGLFREREGYKKKLLVRLCASGITRGPAERDTAPSSTPSLSLSLRFAREDDPIALALRRVHSHARAYTPSHLFSLSHSFEYTDILDENCIGPVLYFLSFSVASYILLVFRDTKSQFFPRDFRVRENERIGESGLSLSRLTRTNPSFVSPPTPPHRYERERERERDDLALFRTCIWITLFYFF